MKYLRAGGGLSIIHFANGAFNFSLPGAGRVGLARISHQDLPPRVGSHARQERPRRVRGRFASTSRTASTRSLAG